MIRSIVRVIYRYYNDGDFYFRGYGKETVLPSVEWLTTYESPIRKKLKSLLVLAKRNAPKSIGKYEYENQFTEQDGYANVIYDAASLIVKYVKSKADNYTPNESEDSR